MTHHVGEPQSPTARDVNESCLGGGVVIVHPVPSHVAATSRSRLLEYSPRARHDEGPPHWITSNWICGTHPPGGTGTDGTSHVPGRGGAVHAATASTTVTAAVTARTNP